MRQPSIFIPHGAGPGFFMDFGISKRSMWTQTSDYLTSIASRLTTRPTAILVISAHWEAAVPTINTARVHTLYYDYYGAEPAGYEFRYPATGDPVLADRVAGLLAGAGIPSAFDAARGLDHGVFIPLMLMFPDGDIPVVQLSLASIDDPEVHLAIGQAIAPLRDEGVLIVGSGMSAHNPAIIMAGLKGIADVGSQQFDAWLVDAVTQPVPEHRDAALIDWKRAPAALHCHPRSEHLLPLHVVAGASDGDVGERVFSDRFLGATFSAFHFG